MFSGRSRLSRTMPVVAARLSRLHEPAEEPDLEHALMTKLLAHYRRFDESPDNPYPSPLGTPLDRGFNTLKANECFWSEAHEAERWEWLNHNEGHVILKSLEGDISLRFQYAYTCLVLVEEPVLTARVLQEHDLPLAPDRAAVLLRPLDSLRQLRKDIMWYAETPDYTEAFNRGCNDAQQLVWCSWCPGHRCARVMLRINATTAPAGARYS